MISDHKDEEQFNGMLKNLTCQDMPIITRYLLSTNKVGQIIYVVVI
jgi:hypothetical protein